MRTIRSYNLIMKKYINNPMTFEDYRNNATLAEELKDNLDYLYNITDEKIRLEYQSKLLAENYIKYILNEKRIYLQNANTIRAITSQAISQYKFFEKQYGQQLKQHSYCDASMPISPATEEIYIAGTYNVDNPYLTKKQNAECQRRIIEKYIIYSKPDSKCGGDAYFSIYGIPIIFYGRYESEGLTHVNGSYYDCIDIFTGKTYYENTYLKFKGNKELERSELINILNGIDAQSVQNYKMQMSKLCSELLQYYNNTYYNHRQEEKEIRLKLARLGSDYIKN